jgi:hypothetical protein
MIKISEGATVKLLEDQPDLGLKAGDQGRAWCIYNTDPPSYEVTFFDEKGQEFDITMDEEDLILPTTYEEPANDPTLSALHDL